MFSDGHLGEQTPDRPIVVVVEGSLAPFAAKAASLSSAFVAFSSDGCSLLAGLRIGEAIRRKRFSTIVPEGRRCASACALAWLGGIGALLGPGAKSVFTPLTIRPRAKAASKMLWSTDI